MSLTKSAPSKIYFTLIYLMLGSLLLNAADTKHIEMDYGNTLFMSLDSDWPENENTIRKALVQKLQTKALPEKGTPIGKGRFIKVRNDIENTELDSVYKYQRERSSGYLIAIPKGNYKVTLQFAEIKRKNHGERVFDIILQDKLIKSDFDPLKVSGAQFTAIDIEVENIEVEQFLKLELVQKSERSTPAIAGIIIENDNFTQKINCGGAEFEDYQADWAKTEYMEDPFSTGVIFDTELLKYSAAWLNGFIKLKGTAFDATHGTHPEIQGDQIWGSGYMPGWIPEGQQLNDPRDEHLGHLDKNWAHYKGLYRHKDGNIIHYTVNGSKVLDKMELLKVPAKTVGQAYVRTIQTDNLKSKSDLLLLEIPGAYLIFNQHGNNSSLFYSESGYALAFKGIQPDGIKCIERKIEEDTLSSILVSVPAGKQHFSVAIYKTETPEALPAFQEVFAQFNLKDLYQYTKGSSLNWPGMITTKGSTGPNKGTFTIDEITMPVNNPWRSWMRPGAFDFTPDGNSLYMSTWSGDVWKASNLNDLNILEWKRYAAGLFHPLGLKIVGNDIYVQCRDQIVILKDLNQDGEADYYQNFNNDVVITENFHEFSFDLHRDKAGNFYFIKGAPVITGGEGFGECKIHHGKLFKVNPDGSQLTVIASGFRAPNGLGMGPNGQLSGSDNEGDWVAATPLNWIKEGGFYGVKPTYNGTNAPEKRDDLICWIPHKVDNSAGGQVWVPEGEWGPYGGEMFHLSYGQAKVFHVLKEEVNSQIQGGVVALKPSGEFEAGIMRARFNNHDKAIYLCGLKGWQTSGVKDGGFYRMRYTGEETCRPIDLKVGQNGIKIEFSSPVKSSAALDAGNYDLSRWVYAISEEYGSKHYRVPPDRSWDLKSEWNPLPQTEIDSFNKLSFESEKEKKAAFQKLKGKFIGEDQVRINSISISDDQKTVFLEILDIKPVMQMKVSFNIESQNNQKVSHNIYHTIHQLGSWSGKPGEKILASTLKEPQAGLILKFNHKGQNKSDLRVQRMAAFHIAEKAPLTQFLDHGPFTAQFNGFIKVERNMLAKFSTHGSGTGTMSLNGNIVFRDKAISSNDHFEVQLKKGFNKLNLIYQSPDKADATFRLYWESKGAFPLEPIPAHVLFHEAGSDELNNSHMKRRGLQTALNKNCFQCHDANSDIQIPELQRGKISLNQLGERVNRQWVSEYITNPKNLNLHAQMPVMLKNLPEDEWQQAAADIASYLTENQKTNAELEADSKQGAETFSSLGCASCHSFDKEPEQENLYSLYNVGFKYLNGAISQFLLQPNKHKPSIKMPNFHLSQDEANNLEVFLRSKASSREATKVSGVSSKGQEYFQQLNCASCHNLDGEKAQKQKSIFNESAGCLVSGGEGKPYFGLTQKERDELSVFLKEGHEALQQREVIEFSAREIKSQQCQNCHTRDGQPSQWSSSNKVPSSLPPSISHTGEKLLPEFLKGLLKGKLNEDTRPWMKARMPHFENSADDLAEGIIASHGFSMETKRESFAENKEIGSELVLQNGFACIICHDVDSTKALAPFGAPGPNLKLSGQRLRHEYYRRWMLDPHRAEPTTHMTKFSSDHQTTAISALDGDARKQFDAIWGYLRSLDD